MCGLALIPKKEILPICVINFLRAQIRLNPINLSEVSAG